MLVASEVGNGCWWPYDAVCWTGSRLLSLGPADGLAITLHAKLVPVADCVNGISAGGGFCLCLWLNNSVGWIGCRLLSHLADLLLRYERNQFSTSFGALAGGFAAMMQAKSVPVADFGFVFGLTMRYVGAVAVWHRLADLLLRFA